jgi:alkylated DNA nucleotide flippase Atl1
MFGVGLCLLGWSEARTRPDGGWFGGLQYSRLTLSQITRVVARMTWNDVKDPSPDFVNRVLEIVKTIPPGRVMTYGDIADEIGAHADLTETAGAYGARLVGQVMARFGSEVAWWRVIRATGEPPKFHESAAWAYYLDEDTPVTGPPEDYRIDLKRARYRPGADPGRQVSLDLF